MYQLKKVLVADCHRRKLDDIRVLDLHVHRAGGLVEVEDPDDDDISEETTEHQQYTHPQKPATKQSTKYVQQRHKYICSRISTCMSAAPLTSDKR